MSISAAVDAPATRFRKARFMATDYSRTKPPDIPKKSRHHEFKPGDGAGVLDGSGWASRQDLFRVGCHDGLDIEFAALLAFDLKGLVRIAEAAQPLIADLRLRHEPKRKVLIFDD